MYFGTLISLLAFVQNFPRCQLKAVVTTLEISLIALYSSEDSMLALHIDAVEFHIPHCLFHIFSKKSLMLSAPLVPSLGVNVISLKMKNSFFSALSLKQLSESILANGSSTIQKNEGDAAHLLQIREKQTKNIDYITHLVLGWLLLFCIGFYIVLTT